MAIIGKMGYFAIITAGLAMMIFVEMLALRRLPAGYSRLGAKA